VNCNRQLDTTTMTHQDYSYSHQLPRIYASPFACDSFPRTVVLHFDTPEEADELREWHKAYKLEHPNPNAPVTLDNVRPMWDELIASIKSREECLRVSPKRVRIEDVQENTRASPVTEKSTAVAPRTTRKRMRGIRRQLTC